MAEDKRQEEKEFSFVKEKIKHQPVYQSKLFRKAVFQIVMAVVCGVIACFVFVMVHPWMEQKFGREEKTEITLPEEEEPVPEETQVPEETTDTQDTQDVQPTDPIVITQKKELELSDYEALYRKMRAVVSESERSLVTVTAENSDTDWFNQTYESQNQLSGLIVGDNSVELLILTSYSEIASADRLEVTFADNSSKDAALKNYDPVTDLAVISVNLADISQGTMDYIKMAELGSSTSLHPGEPVIAAGSPAGVPGSMLIGNLAVTGYKVNVIDGEYTLLITDMRKASSSSGVLLNLDGKVIGLIQDAYTSTGSKDALTAYAITGMKSIIEHLSNSKDIVYLGITGADVTQETASEQNMPLGVYVTGVELNSPAMNAGIQAGDIVTKINGQEIYKLADIQDILLKFSREQVIQIEVMRRGKEEYQEIACSVALGQLK